MALTVPAAIARAIQAPFAAHPLSPPRSDRHDRQSHLQHRGRCGSTGGQGQGMHVSRRRRFRKYEALKLGCGAPSGPDKRSDGCASTPHHLVDPSLPTPTRAAISRADPRVFALRLLRRANNLGDDALLGRPC